MRSSNGTEYTCSWDAHTLFTRREWPIQASDLTAGEPVEVIADRKPGAPVGTCYARIFSVVDATSATPSRRRSSVAEAPTREAWRPRGYLNFAGLVTQMTGTLVTLATRSGPLTLALRMDTAYTGDGIRLKSPETLVNKHVFIRAA